MAAAANVTGRGSGGASVASSGLGMGNLDTQMYTTSSLMATGNTHHIFDSTPPIQDDPFQQSSNALTSLLGELSFH
jgi:hypothetical protein